MMKKIIVALIVLLITLSISAQENDSILLEEVKSLKKELGLLKKKDRSLQSQIYQQKKAFEKAFEKALKNVEQEFAARDESLGKNSARTSELEQVLKVSEEKARTDRTEMAEWTKKMMMILVMVALLFFIVLLILVITNRRRIEKDYLKLEAKVENTREAIDMEIKNILKKHEEDITALKDTAAKGKK